MWPQMPLFGALFRVMFIWLLQYIRNFWGIPLSFKWTSRNMASFCTLMRKCHPRSHCLAHWAGWYSYDFYSIFAAFEESHWTLTGYLQSCFILHFYEQMRPRKPLFGALSRVIFIWFLQYIRSFWRMPLNFNWISKELLNFTLLWANVTPEATVWRTAPGDIYDFYNT